MEIRPANTADYPTIHALMLEFALFQKTPEKVTITVNQMIKDKDFFKSYVVTDKGTIIGFASYYLSYNSWTGKSLYLDDIYLTPAARGMNIGNRIMDKLASIAKSNDCTKMRWLVSKWNESAIGFYKKRGAVIYDTEYVCDFDIK